MTWSTKAKAILDLLSTVLVSVAAVFLLWTQVESRWLNPAQRPSPEDVKGLRIEGSKIRHMKGTGGVALVEFTDYECPFCGEYARSTAPTVDNKLVATGAVRHVVFSFPLEGIHKRARKASEAAECAARQGLYWQMHQRLFSNQQALNEEALFQSSDALGLTRPDFERCLAGEAADDITADVREGHRLGVNSTPTFFVGTLQKDGSIQLAKRITGAIPFDALKNVIEVVAQKRNDAVTY